MSTPQLHQVAGAVGEALEEVAELAVGGEEDLRLAVELGGGAERGGFDPGGCAVGRGGGKFGGEPVEAAMAASWTLVCGGGEGPGRWRATHPPGVKLTGASDVDEVGAETVEGALDAGEMTKSRIEGESFSIPTEARSRAEARASGSSRFD